MPKEARSSSNRSSSARQRGGSQASTAVNAEMTPAAFQRLDSMFTNQFAPKMGGGGGSGSGSREQKQKGLLAKLVGGIRDTVKGMSGKPAPKKKPVAAKGAKPKAAKKPATAKKGGRRQAGGSQASDAVTGRVNASSFATIERAMAGGCTPCHGASGTSDTSGTSRKSTDRSASCCDAGQRQGQRGGSVSSDAVLSHVDLHAFAATDALMGSVLPMAGGAAKKVSAASSAKCKKVSVASSAKGKKVSAASSAKGKGKGKGKMHGGQGETETCAPGVLPNEANQIFSSNDISKMPVSQPTHSETAFSSCEYKDIFAAPGALMGIRSDYTVLPKFDGSSFFLPMPR